MQEYDPWHNCSTTVPSHPQSRSFGAEAMSAAEGSTSHRSAERWCCSLYTVCSNSHGPSVVHAAGYIFTTPFERRIHILNMKLNIALRCEQLTPSVQRSTLLRCTTTTTIVASTPALTRIYTIFVIGLRSFLEKHVL